MSRSESADVLVIGAGGAGLAAALSAVEHGAQRVVIVEAGSAVGGSTALSAGSFLAAGTATQAAAGWPGDTADAMLDHFLTASGFDAEVGLVHALCRDSAPTLDWLLAHGVEMGPNSLNRAGREAVPRSHRFSGQGAALINALATAALAADVKIHLENRVNRLTVRDERVVGVEVGTHAFPAEAVVLASGGFASDRELVREHIGDDTVWAGSTATSPAAPTACGDGLRLTADLGCRTANRGGTVVRLNPSFPAGDLYLPPWLLLVDPDGRRFADESAPPQSFRETLTGRGGRCWAVFDAKGRAAFGAPRKGLVRGVSWAETIVDQLEAGKIVSAPDLVTLAHRIGVESVALAATVARYGTMCAEGKDRDYEKPAEYLQSVDSAPFYATELRAHVVLISGYGLEIEADAAVRRGDRTVVPGLFAAGEVTGNTIGARYPGQGAAITNALVFGRIAGRSAARYAALGCTGPSHSAP